MGYRLMTASFAAAVALPVAAPATLQVYKDANVKVAAGADIVSKAG